MIRHAAGFQILQIAVVVDLEVEIDEALAEMTEMLQCSAAGPRLAEAGYWKASR